MANDFIRSLSMLFRHRTMPLVQNVARFSIDQIGIDCAERPFDYVNKRYNRIQTRLNPILGNIGDNTLLLSVTGNLGSQKSMIARKIADQIKFLYVPPPDVDRMYFAKLGYDEKQMFNDCVMEDRQVLNREEWLSGKVDKSSTTRYYFYEYKTRIHQYRLACMHLLSTGQGVVMDGCYWTDPAVMKALSKRGLLSDECVEAINEIHEMFDCELKRPFLIIHIDRPVEECLAQLKHLQMNGEEPKSTFFEDLDFLKELEHQQNLILTKFEDHSHVLRYNYDDVLCVKLFSTVKRL